MDDEHLLPNSRMSALSRGETVDGRPIIVQLIHPSVSNSSKEAADLALFVDKMNLQNPVAQLGFFVC